MNVSLRVDDRQVRVPDGMTLTAALVQAGVRAVSVNPVSGASRGPFCGMGVCFECEVLVDGHLVRACLTPATDGMAIETAAKG
jgi:predicted molibdopterin-dependent oxidoreductase YjgC